MFKTGLLVEMTDIKILGKFPEILYVYRYDCLASDSVLKRQSRGKQNCAVINFSPSCEQFLILEYYIIISFEL